MNWKPKLPTREQIFANRWFKPFARWFDAPEFWELTRDKVALSVAIGLFCGMLPAPTQFASALVLAYVMRTQLPVAMFTTLYTNPLTIVPLYVMAYELGNIVLYGNIPKTELVFPVMEHVTYWHTLKFWLAKYGKPLLVGVPVMGLTLAVIGYALVHLFWHKRTNQQP